MQIPTEPIGSIPRPSYLIEAWQKASAGEDTTGQLEEAIAEATSDTVKRFEATGSPVISDGEQAKSSFATYPLNGLSNLVPGGVTIPFADGHTRQLPALSEGPFRYARAASSFLKAAQKLTQVPVKQAVISASALSLIYPQGGLPDYPQEQFLDDLVLQAENDIRECLAAGAANVQIDFTEGRLAVKLDPSLTLLNHFINLNNRVLDRFTDEERRKIGVHSCPGGDRDATHSADVDYSELLPALFKLRVTNFYLQLASEGNRQRVLKLIGANLGPEQKVFVGVIDPINPKLETPEEVCDRVLEASEFIPVNQLGTTDDCGFSPFCDDTSTSRDLAFEKIQARVIGTRLASERLSKTGQ